MRQVSGLRRNSYDEKVVISLYQQKLDEPLAQSIETDGTLVSYESKI